MKKRILSIFLACVMLLSLLPTMALAADGIPAGAVAYVTDANGAPVDAGGEGSGDLGGGYYKTLQAAINAVPTNGTETTITMIGNDVYAADENMTIAAGQKIVLDLNGHTVSGTCDKGDGQSFTFITNNGDLTVKDSSEAGNGKITGAFKAGSSLGGFYTVNNCNILTLESGTIENTSETVGYNGVTSFLHWALRNSTAANKTVTFNMTGGTVVGNYNAISNYFGHGASTLNLNISGGLIKTNRHFSAMTLQNDQTTDGTVNVNISGGEFVTSHVEGKNGNATIYYSDLREHAHENVNISVTGGKFYTAGAARFLDDDEAKTTNSLKRQYLAGGIYSFEVTSSEIAPDYECVANTDGATKKDYPYVVQKMAPVAQIGTGNSAQTFTSLAAAIAAAQSGETVQLLTDVTQNDTIVITNKNITLDIGTHNITGNKTGNAWWKILDVNVGATLTLEGTGSITNTYSAYAVMGEYTSNLIIDGPTLSAVDSEGGFSAVSLWDTAQLTVKSGTLNGRYYAICDNGGESPSVNMTIEGGTFTGNEGAAIFHPGGGVLKISGGTLQGTNGIYTKSGTTIISGGTIIGTGDAANYEYKASGYKQTGDALSIDSCNYPNGAPVVSITGGMFKSENNHAVASYAGNSATAVTGFLKGGYFNKVVDSAYIAAGYV